MFIIDGRRATGEPRFPKKQTTLEIIVTIYRLTKPRPRKSQSAPKTA
jgi:hypothetical protein